MSTIQSRTREKKAKTHVRLTWKFPWNSCPTTHHPWRPRGSQSVREKRRDESFQVRVEEPLGTDSFRTISKNSILGHPGAVSRLGRKGGTKVFKFGRKSPWVPTLTGPFPKIQADAGSWLGTKMLCIIVPNRRTVSPQFFSWVRTRQLLSRHTCPVRSPSLCVQGKLLFSTFPTRNEGTTDDLKKTFRMLSAGASEFAPRIFCFWRITMYRKQESPKDDF